ARRAAVSCGAGSGCASPTARISRCCGRSRGAGSIHKSGCPESCSDARSCIRDGRPNVRPVLDRDARVLTAATQPELSGRRAGTTPAPSAPAIGGSDHGGIPAMRTCLSMLALATLLLASMVSPALAEWPTLGRAIDTAPGDQLGPVIAGDGAGGAIVAWSDRRNFPLNIGVQHVLANG